MSHTMICLNKVPRKMESKALAMNSPCCVESPVVQLSSDWKKLIPSCNHSFEELDVMEKWDAIYLTAYLEQ